MLKWCVVSLDMMHKVNLGVELPAIGNAHSNMFVYTPNYTYAQVLMEVMDREHKSSSFFPAQFCSIVR